MTILCQKSNTCFPTKSGGSSLTASHIESRVREELIQLGVLDDSEGESEDEVRHAHFIFSKQSNRSLR